MSSTGIRAYYQNSIDAIGNAVNHAEKLSKDGSVFQKTWIAGQASILITNALRGTTQLIGLAHRCSYAFVPEFFGLVPDALARLKPVNVNTIHGPALAHRIVDVLVADGRVEDTTVDKKIAFDSICTDLDQFFDQLTDINQGQLFGFATSEEFLAAFQKHMNLKYEEDFEEGFFGDRNLVDLIPPVPLIHVSWSEYLTTKTFQVVGTMTVVSYLNEWNLIDTASWAASIGGVQGFGWVAQVDFHTVFMGALFTGFALAVVVATKKIYAACVGDQTVGNNEKARAPFAFASALAEAVYFKRSFFTELGVINNNPLFAAISLFIAKTVGIFCIIEQPVENRFDIPLSQVQIPEGSVTGRIKLKASKFFEPITQERHVAATAKAVHTVATRVFEVINDFLNIRNDGYDKLCKMLPPVLSIADRALTNAEITSGALFTKCISGLKGFQKLLYAAKFFSALKHFFVPVPNEKNRYMLSTPFHFYNPKTEAYEVKVIDGLSRTLLDISAFCDLASFLRTSEIYRFDYLVSIGNQLAEKQISIFGHSAQVKTIPALKEINGTVKNLPIIANALLRMTEQAWKAIVLGDKKQLESAKLLDFAGHAAKVVICSTYANAYWYDLTCLIASQSGFKYLVAQHKLRRKIEAKAAA